MKINHYDNRIEVEGVIVTLAPDIFVEYTVCFPLKTERTSYEGPTGPETHSFKQVNYDHATAYVINGIHVGNKESQIEAIDRAIDCLAKEGF